MGLYDSFHGGLTYPNCGCQATVEAQTKDSENAMLTYSIGEPVEPLTQADLPGFTGCRWCEASIEVPILVREGPFIALLRDWVRAKAGIDGRFSLFRDDKRAVQKTLERLERALGIMEERCATKSESSGQKQ
jgi:hypothetical protein